MKGRVTYSNEAEGNVWDFIRMTEGSRGNRMFERTQVGGRPV